MEVAQRIGQLQKVPATAKSAQRSSSLLETSNSLRLLGSISKGIPLFCSQGCVPCDDSDKCYLKYHETECSMLRSDI